MIAKFLICKTKESAEKLRAMGFEEIPSGAAGTFVFLNKTPNEVSFGNSNEEPFENLNEALFQASNDIAYTDVLSL